MIVLKIIKRKKNIINISIFLIVVFIIFCLFGFKKIKAEVNKSRFFTLNQKKYFILASNIRNYDAYGLVFKENGKSPEKIFLGKGMADRGYIMLYGEESIMISNPSQGNAYIINKNGFVNNINFDEKIFFPIFHKKYFLAYYPYIISFSNDENINFSNKNSNNANILLKPHKIILGKNNFSEIKIFDIDCQWINQVFIEKDLIYVIYKKNNLQKKYVIEAYSINSGEKIKESYFPIEENSFPNPKEISIHNETLAFFINNKTKNESKNKILFFDLKEMKLIKEFIFHNNFLFNRINHNGTNFSLIGSFKEKNETCIIKYIIFNNINYEIEKNININSNNGIIKKEYVLKDFLEDKKYYYIFYQVYEFIKHDKKFNNIFNEIMLILSSIIGAYEGPKNETMVCVYDKKTGIQIEKIIFEINDERLKNGTIIPVLLNNKEGRNDKFSIFNK